MYSFPLDEDEQILKKGMASVHVDDNTLTGALYLTDRRLVFVGYLLDITRKYMEDIPFARISTITAAKTFYILPNAIEIITIAKRKIRIVVDTSERNGWITEIEQRINEC